METYLAHIDDNGNGQTVRDHLRGVASLCSQFAESFHASDQGQLIGLAHDIGKCSAEFQQRLQGGKIVDHASAGALECAKQDALWAACCVAGHHGGLPDVGNLRNDLPGNPTLYGRLRKALCGEIPSYEMPLSLPSTPVPDTYGKDYLTDSFVIRMLYSCLVDADYLDTEWFLTGGNGEHGGDSIPELLSKLNQYISPWWNPKSELNALRCDILRTCMNRGSEKKGMYTLTVPTGGGKTIASMAFALNHAVAHHMDRVIYVIPYTSIIEQTADVFRAVFGAANVVEHHSNVVCEVDDPDRAERYRRIRATENWDVPIVITTAVEFFESLYANRPSKCRKLHNIANSIIVFDEAQMLPAEHLRPCVAAIAKLVHDFGVTAVLCTATQPFLNDLFEQYAPGIAIEELCQNPSALFQKFRRVTYHYDGGLNTALLAQKLSEHQQVLCIVNSRKSAQDIYKELPPEGSYHLSTLMTPAHRRAALTEIRDRLAGGFPCRVVSTSLIEAGVDVDFPAVFREMAGLDSLLQAAGRCNREGKRAPEESVVTFFDGVSATPQMLEVNIGAAREALRGGADPAAPETIERYFKAYRSLAGTRLDAAGAVTAFEHGINGCMLPFRTVAERFHLIGDVTRTVYIPLEEGAELIRRFQAGERSRQLFRKLGQYSVNIYEKHYVSLLESGALEPLDEESAILRDIRRYDRKLGLCLCDMEGRDFFI